MTAEDPPPPASSLLLAAIRAAGGVAAPRSADLLQEVAQAAQRVGRSALQLRAAGEEKTTLRLAWPTGGAPSIEQLRDQAPPTLAPIPTLVWALCLKAAWPDPTLPHYPGQPFPAELIETAARHLGASARAVATALTRTLPGRDLITPVGPLIHLGPAVATLPGPTVTALRRGHHRLPDPQENQEPPPSGGTAATIGDQTPHATAPHDLTHPDPPPPHSSDHIVCNTITALETARGPLPPRDLPALQDPDIRADVQSALTGIGRTLIRTPQGTWTTGYPDTVAEALNAADIGTLTPAQRTVLAVILLHTVALPRAQGRHTHAQWDTTQHGVTQRQLGRNRALSKLTITSALRTLIAAGLVDTTGQGTYVPGPCMQRLSETRITALWEDLIIAGRPQGHLARAIQQRRQAARPTASPQEHP
ncbi:hypothetical protein [Streptomyces sp. NPDC018059]|uniref:hypothetical protein n=1 Tax=Streptomyces sp. NPDC018059 TaxID=3365041 RepID=UPI0037A3DA69